MPAFTAALRRNYDRADFALGRAIYGEPDATAAAQASAHSIDFFPCYREPEKSRIIAAVRAGASLLVVGGAGCGKSTLARFVAAELQQMNFAVAIAEPTTQKQFMLDLSEQFGLSTSSLEGRAQTSTQLQESVAEHVRAGGAFLIVDDAHRLPVALRCWLEKFVREGLPVLLFATPPPPRDIFLKLPRIELQDLSNKSVRAIMESAAAERGVKYSTAKLSALQERCAGNPMLARRVVTEEHLGLDETAPDHTKWIDGTPLLMAGLLCFMFIRVFARGMHMNDLRLFGMVIFIL
jgi:energy-coupling factor transporter ATP-binding protein EcfA2